MSYHPYRLQSIEDETRLLQKMFALQGKVRRAKEKERRLKTTQSSHYTKMFQPITNSLKKLQTVKPVLNVDTSTSTDHEDEKYDDSDDDEILNLIPIMMKPIQIQLNPAQRISGD